MLLFNSWIFGLSATLFYFLITPFIKVWIGADNLLPQLVLVVMTLHVYIRGMRKTPSAFKEAGGVFYEDRYIPVIESIVNLVASLILTHYFGLAGVLMGTIISTMVVYIFNYPKYVYEKLLHGTKKEYAWLYFKHAIVALLVFGVNYVALSFITITNPILEFLIYGIIIVIISNILYFIIYYRTADFEFYKKQILRKIWNKLKKRKVKS